MISEFGFEGNRHGPVEERGTYEFQADMARYHLGVFASKPYLSGAIWFALQNFAAGPGWTGGDPQGDPPFVEKGEIDQYGNPTPLFPVIQSIYKSTVQIAPVQPAAAGPSARRCPRTRGDAHAGLARRARTGSAAACAITRNAVERGELLALLGGARPVVHRDLEDPLAALDQPGGDLGLDREARPSAAAGCGRGRSGSSCGRS